MGIGSLSAASVAALGSAAVGAGASLYGASSSAAASKASAQAIADSNAATSRAQNEGYTSRLNAALAQTGAQQKVMDASYETRTTAADAMRDSQLKALKDYQDVLDTENTQAESLRKTGDTAAQTLLSQTTGTKLTDAQTSKEQEAKDLLKNYIPGPAESDPSGNAATGDTATQAATSRRTAEAATNIRDYGSKIGKVAGYEAPVDTVESAVGENKIGIMPAQYANSLLRAGNATRLLPTQIAYDAATGLGKAQDTLLQTRAQSGLDLASLSYSNATDIANLKQADIDTTAKNKSAQQQANAAYDLSTANTISGLGKLGLYGAGYLGGDKLSGLFTPSTGDFSPRSDAIV